MRDILPLAGSLLFVVATLGCHRGDPSPSDDAGGALDADQAEVGDGRPDGAMHDAADGAIHDATDGALGDADELDAGGDDGGSLATCSFNSDCPATERCECDEEAGCFCRTGARGTGVNGVDSCVDGNDCETALCVEGAEDVYYCSGECDTPDDCGPNLPLCSSIAFVGRICVRTPPG